MSNRSVFSMILLASLAATPLVAQEPDHGAHQAPLIGSVNFRNSGSKAAQEPFQRGVAWLHNFKYREAGEAFREAQRIDPTLAVAYWFEALSYSHVLWSEEDLVRSRQALARLGSTPELRLAKAGSPRERTFGAAVEAFYANSPLAVRVRAYADSLLALAASDSSDLEAAAFAAHASLISRGSAPPADRQRIGATARALALRVFTANPKHPGAAHYLTHIADTDPHNAAELLPFARAYDKIAPDADHALHMPSHVYLPLGLWRDVSSSNERAWAASRAEVKRNKDSQAELSWHSLEWLQYAYLQQGRWAAARRMVDSAISFVKGVDIAPDNPDARFAAGFLAFTYGVETGDWTAWKFGTRDMPGGFSSPTPTGRAWIMSMTNGYQEAVTSILSGGDRKLAEAAAKHLRVVSDTLPPGMPRTNVLRFANHLDALLARADGDLPRAIAILRTVAENEQVSASMPPTHLPTHELLGEMLLQAKQPREANAAYRAALAARPNRSRAVIGLSLSLRAMGDVTGAEDALRLAMDNFRGADAAALRSLADAGRRGR